MNQDDLRARMDQVRASCVQLAATRLTGVSERQLLHTVTEELANLSCHVPLTWAREPVIRSTLELITQQAGTSVDRNRCVGWDVAARCHEAALEGRGVLSGAPGLALQDSWPQHALGHLMRLQGQLRSAALGIFNRSVTVQTWHSKLSVSRSEQGLDEEGELSQRWTLMCSAMTHAPDPAQAAQAVWETLSPLSSLDSAEYSFASAALGANLSQPDAPAVIPRWALPPRWREVLEDPARRAHLAQPTRHGEPSPLPGLMRQWVSRQSEQSLWALLGPTSVIRTQVAHTAEELSELSDWVASSRYRVASERLGQCEAPASLGPQVLMGAALDGARRSEARLSTGQQRSAGERTSQDPEAHIPRPGTREHILYSAWTQAMVTGRVKGQSLEPALQIAAGLRYLLNWTCGLNPVERSAATGVVWELLSQSTKELLSCNWTFEGLQGVAEQWGVEVSSQDLMTLKRRTLSCAASCAQELAALCEPQPHQVSDLSEHLWPGLLTGLCQLPGQGASAWGHPLAKAVWLEVLERELEHEVSDCRQTLEELGQLTRQHHPTLFNLPADELDPWLNWIADSFGGQRVTTQECWKSLRGGL